MQPAYRIVHGQRSLKIVVLDRDSSESRTYGEQQRSAYDGHFGCTCYHLVFVLNYSTSLALEQCALRPGNVNSAGGGRGVTRLLKKSLALGDEV